MALIARAAYQNDTVKKVSSTLSYQIPATKKASARTVTMGHKMLNPGDSRYYPGVIGGKTGFTSLAGNTLVTCVEKNGVRLIAVIMKSKSTHYEDTKSLLDYGFALKAAGGTAKASSQGWVQEGTKWYYGKQDGNKACNEWQNLNGVYYWFDADSFMAASRWVESNGKWYYLDKQSGEALVNGYTPEGYYVDGSGAWNGKSARNSYGGSSFGSKTSNNTGGNGSNQTGGGFLPHRSPESCRAYQWYEWKRSYFS